MIGNELEDEEQEHIWNDSKKPSQDVTSVLLENWFS